MRRTPPLTVLETLETHCQRNAPCFPHLEKFDRVSVHTGKLLFLMGLAGKTDS